MAVVAACLLAGTVASAAAPWPDVRWGGVVDQSYRYHRKIEPGSARAGGWYGWGFPVRTYEWGWFGAEHYWPVVVWHHGYNGDSVRWAYRQGY